MIQYYIDGSTKDRMIGVGIVKVNEFGFIEKYHFCVEHIQPTSSIAEGYSLEKTLEMIKHNDLQKNEMINIYTDCQKLHQLFLYNEKMEFSSSLYFTKQESHHYFQHIRNLYVGLISKFSNYPMYHCEKTKQARPLINIFYQDQVKDKKYLQYAHDLSREYIKEEPKTKAVGPKRKPVEARPKAVESKQKPVEPKPKTVEHKTKPIEPKAVKLNAKRENDTWYILKEKKVLAENKRPIIALANALDNLDPSTSNITLCHNLNTLVKNTRNTKITNGSMKKAMKIIDKHSL